MMNKELKKLSRKELVDIIYQMKKKEEELESEIASLKEALEEKRMRLSVAGSIADAATTITNIFSAAQMTADLYLREISCMKEDAERECAEILEENKRMAARLDAQYAADYKKWQQLREEIKALENAANGNQVRG